MGIVFYVVVSVLTLTTIIGCRDSQLNSGESVLPGPTSSELDSLSLEEIEVLQSLYPRRFDLQQQYYERIGTLKSELFWEIVKSNSLTSNEQIPVEKRMYLQKVDQSFHRFANSHPDISTYPIFAQLEGITEDSITALAKQHAVYSKVPELTPWLLADSQFRHIAVALSLSQPKPSSPSWMNCFPAPYEGYPLNGIGTDSLFDLAYDPLDGSLYISSLSTNQIWRGIRQNDVEWEFTPFTAPRTNQFGQPRGLMVDNLRRMLWALSTAPDALYGYSLVTGKPMRRIEAPESSVSHRFTELCMLSDSVIYITAYESGSVFEYQINDLSSTLEQIVDTMRFPFAITAMNSHNKVYVASVLDGIFEIHPGMGSPIRPDWPQRVFDAGISDLFVMSYGRLTAKHTHFNPNEFVRYTYDSSNVQKSYVRVPGIVFESGVVPIRNVVASDTLFTLVRYERPIGNKNSDTLQPGVPGIEFRNWDSH